MRNPSVLSKCARSTSGHRMASTADTPARSKSSLRCLLYLAQSGALDHGLTVRTGAYILDLLNFSNCDTGQYARPPTLTPTNFSIYCWWSANVRYASPGENAHLNIIAGRLGEIVVGPRVSSRRLPAGHLVINHLSSVQDIKIRRIRVQFLSKRLASPQSIMISLASQTSPSIL